MEGVFQSPTSTTEFNFAQDSKRVPSEVNHANMPLSETRSNNSTTASNLRSSRPLGDITSKLQSIASMSRLRSSNENNHGGFSTSSQLKSNFQAATERLKTLTKDEENVLETSMHIADEQKNKGEITIRCEDWRPSVGTQRTLLSQRSKTPLSTSTSKGNSTARKENIEIPTPRVFLNESGPIVESTTARRKSPGLAQYYSSNVASGERYFQVSTGRIVEKSSENRSLSTLKRASYTNRAPSMKMSKSRAGESAQNSFSNSTSMKKPSRMDSLKDIKLIGSPNASSGARLGINLVKETLEEVLIEKDTLKAQVEQLRNAIKEEKASIEKLNENMRFMTTSMESLTKKNENLDKSTTNTQTLVGRTLEEVCQMQEEVNSYMEVLKQINEQIELEREMVRRSKEQTAVLKAYLAGQTKEKEALKGHLEVSRHSRKKSQEKYNNTEKTHTAFATVLEDQFRRYAAE